MEGLARLSLELNTTCAKSLTLAMIRELAVSSSVLVDAPVGWFCTCLYMKSAHRPPSSLNSSV